MSDRASLMGDLLAARRAELGYSLAVTVKRCEKPISIAYLQKIEQGRVEAPSPFVLHELAHALALPYPTLMEAAGYVYPCGQEPPKAGALVSALLQAEDLTPDEAKRLEAYLVRLAALWRTDRLDAPEADDD